MSTKQIAATALRDGMDSAKQAVIDARKRVNALREQRDTLRMMMDTVLFFLTQMNRSSLSVWVSDGYKAKPTVTFYMNGIDGFKDPNLARAIEFISILCPEAETRDYPEAINRDYSFKGESFDVRIAAYVKNDSESCKRIEVSRKSVQRDEIQYKLVCD